MIVTNALICAARSTSIFSFNVLSSTFSKLFTCNRIKLKTFCTDIQRYKIVLKDSAIQNFLDARQVELNELSDKEKGSPNYGRLLRLFNQRDTLRGNLEALSDLENEKSNDVDFNNGIKEEKNIYMKLLLKTEYKIIESLSSETEESPCKGVLFEISPGVGGQEAMLFAKTLYDMYCSYIEHKGWHYYIAEEDLSQLGGIRHVSLLVEGPNAYSHLKFESGVHRVQRVPSTEKSGRVHTSTVTVAVIPQPEDVDVSFNEKDLVIETKRSSGAGGQHVNTTDSAVRITHLPSGVVVECQTERSQIKNKAIALARLKAKLYQQQLDEKNNIVRCTRKSQIGIGARSDKIRTYNFNQDRITDHRLSCNIHNLPEFVKGGSLLDQLINNLMATSLENQFDNFISQIKNKNI